MIIYWKCCHGNINSLVLSAVVMWLAPLPVKETTGEVSDDGGGVGRTCEGDTGWGWVSRGPCGNRGDVWESPGGDSGRACVIAASCVSWTWRDDKLCCRSVMLGISFVLLSSASTVFEEEKKYRRHEHIKLPSVSLVYLQKCLFFMDAKKVFAKILVSTASIYSRDRWPIHTNHPSARCITTIRIKWLQKVIKVICCWYLYTQTDQLSINHFSLSVKTN